MKKNTLIPIMVLGLIFLLGAFAFASSRKSTPVVPAAELPKGLPIPTAYATALPGVSVQVMQKFAQGEILTQTAQGVEISAANFRVEEDRLKVDVCYQVATGEEWLVGIAVAKIGDKEIVYDEFLALEIFRTQENGKKQIISSQPNPSSGIAEPVFKEADSDNLPDYRCGIIIFYLEPDTKISDVTITISDLMSSINEGEGCDAYFHNLQSILDAEKTGIRLDCVKQEYGEFTSIAEKPASMSDEEAQRLYNEAVRRVTRIEGPWIFTEKVE